MKLQKTATQMMEYDNIKHNKQGETKPAPKIIFVVKTKSQFIIGHLIGNPYLK